MNTFQIPNAFKYLFTCNHHLLKFTVMHEETPESSLPRPYLNYRCSSISCSDVPTQSHHLTHTHTQHCKLILRTTSRDYHKVGQLAGLHVTSQKCYWVNDTGWMKPTMIWSNMYLGVHWWYKIASYIARTLRLGIIRLVQENWNSNKLQYFCCW